MSSRDQGLARLRESYVSGDLSYAEFAERVDRLLSAKTATDVEEIVQSLPGPTADSTPVFAQTGDAPVRRHLLSDERILWVGKPDPERLFSRADIFLVPFSLAWGGFALLWEALALAGPFGPTGIVFPLFGLPFVLVGLYFIFGRFIYKQRKKLRTTYAVTNRRVLRVVHGARGDDVEAAFLATIPAINSSAGADGVGTVTFGREPPWQSVYANTGLDAFGWTSGSNAISFFDIPSPAKVADLVEKLREERSGR